MMEIGSANKKGVTKLDKMLRHQRFLVIYSAIVTLVFAITLFSGSTRRANKVRFDEMDVQRINIVEPDGTLRMVISSKTLFPGLILKGKEYPHPNRKTAGMLFFNDEGSENGGLIFGGEKGQDGKLSSYGHLSFDEYEKDQVLTIDSWQEGEKSASTLVWNDNPAYFVGEWIDLQERIKSLPQAQQRVESRKFFNERGRPQQRLSIGRSDDQSVALKLKDTAGKDRIVIKVAADGSPILRFLDQEGKVIIQLPENDPKVK
jgi:hypothetical protein